MSCRLNLAKQNEGSGVRSPTIEVGLGALTGRPFALTGARVPALSAALCSRWIYVDKPAARSLRAQDREEVVTYSGFLGNRHGGCSIRPRFQRGGEVVVGSVYQGRFSNVASTLQA